VNNLFAAAFSNTSGDLANIEMKIKGDTYWLGDPILTDAPAPTTAGSAAFVLTVKSPVLYGENGLAAPYPTALNGLYTVQFVDHEFNQGVFTQTLYGTVDRNISNIDELLQ
jgi:hypothetical protein